MNATRSNDTIDPNGPTIPHAGITIRGYGIALSAPQTPS